MALPNTQDIKKRPLNIAIILAGGIGHRAVGSAKEKHLQKPKQFWPLAGLPVWQHSWLRYAMNPAIDKVCLVWPENYIAEIQNIVANYSQTVAPSYIIAGGLERSDSSYQAVEFCQQWQLPQQRVLVLIHDAARPLISSRLIEDSLAQLEFANAVVCATPVQDSLFVKNPENRVEKVLKRSQIMHSQTPQSFELQTLRKAFAKHRQRQEIIPTDDISLVKHYLPAEKIAIVAGDKYNIKLTEAEDLDILDWCYERFMAETAKIENFGNV